MASDIRVAANISENSSIYGEADFDPFPLVDTSPRGATPCLNNYHSHGDRKGAKLRRGQKEYISDKEFSKRFRNT